MNTRRRLLLIALSILVPIVGMGAALLAADIYLHHKAERFAGVNIWGYRGPTLPLKEPGERRIVVIGGSTAFGYGVDWDQAFPAQLERELRPLASRGAPVTVINLGFNTQGAYAFQFALADYESMQPDLAILYEGYNDLYEAPNEFVGRRDSAIFRLTGYYPIFPLVFREKALSLRYGGDLNAAYRGRTVFKPGIADRTTASTLEAAAAIQQQLDAQLARVAPGQPKPTALDHASFGCQPRWADYCRSVHDAVGYALKRGLRVLVVTQPYLEPPESPDAHRAQQEQLRSMLQTSFANDPRVGYADLGNAIDLRANSELVFDGMHLTEAGNAVIARGLVRPVATLWPEAFKLP